MTKAQHPLLDELERLLSHRHASSGAHLHGVEIEVREAHEALERLREAVQEQRLKPELIEQFRSKAACLHLDEPWRFAYLLEQLRREVRS